MSHFQFPPMTDIEKQIMIEWGETDLTLISLMNILGNKLNTASGHSVVDRIKNLHFTKINDKLFDNIFVQIAILRCCHELDTKNGATTMSKPIKNKLTECWNQFIQMYTPV